MPIRNIRTIHISIFKRCIAVAWVITLSLSASAATVVTPEQTPAVIDQSHLNLDGLKLRFQQHYKGIPVFGYSVATTVSSSGLINDVSGQASHFGQANFSTQPTLSAEQAMALTLSNERVSEGEVYRQQNNLYIYMINNKPKLVYLISYVIAGENGAHCLHPVYFIDAHSGDTLYAYENQPRSADVVAGLNDAEGLEGKEGLEGQEVDFLTTGETVGYFVAQQISDATE
ncbi:MAG: Zn-dependent metalloprotease [Phenylobacterium sp.]|jgi:Zn-dependent metalloprotease